MRIITKNGREQIDKKRIVLTHDDADGLMSAVVLQKLGRADGGQWRIIASVNPTSRETDEMLLRADKEWEVSKEDIVFVIDREIFGKELQENFKGKKIIYIDHHIPNKVQNLRNDIVFIWDKNESGATLSLKYFKLFPQEMGEISSKKVKEIERIAQSVKLWDTFQWTKLDTSVQEDKVRYNEVFQINSLEKMFGKKYFYTMMMKDNDESIWKKSKLAYEIFLYEYEEYKENGFPYEKDFEYKGNKIRLYFNFDSRFQSLYSYELFKNTDLDIVIYANLNGTVSIRNRPGTDSTDLASELGRLNGYSGGGHKNATGCRIIDLEMIRDQIVNRILKTIANIEKIIL